MHPIRGPGCLDENTATALVEHQLTDEERGIAEAHLDACSDCRRLVSALVSLDAGTPAVLGRGTSVSRYLLLDVVGAGAMGVVYAAFDPALDRKVALKVLRTASGERAGLEREARAMARLNHPNVVQVYDAGTWGQRLFLVMEFVAGRTLAAYLREHRPDARAIVALFVQVGHGLWAAHGEGVIHRDLKPDNILIDASGQARVGDFGLARVGEVPPGNSGVGAETPGSATSVAGTPAYMAPEQLRGEVATAQSDQFSFCVALHEALTGSRPFTSDHPDGLLSAISRGWQEPSRLALPVHVRRVLRRGLLFDPAARYPSMLALVEDLGQVRARRRAAVATAVGVMASAALLLGGHRAYQARSCRQSADEVSRVWNVTVENRITRAFVESGVPLAGESARGTIAALHRHALAWSEARATLCRGEGPAAAARSPAAAETREQCLRDRLDEVGALVTQIERAEPATVDRATSLSLELTPAIRCMEPAALLAPPREPPPLRARADEVRQRLAEARARYKVGDQSAALTVARQALTGAQALGHPPLLAEALLRLGDIEMYSGTPEAEAHLVAAVRAAEAAQADRLKAQAANSLSFVVGYEKRRYQQGLDWSDFALAVLDRLGGDDAQSSLVHVNRGAVLLAQERTDEAAQSFERALALAAQAGLGQRAEAAGRLNLANARREQRRYPEAAAAYERAIQLFRETYGPRFPSIGMALHGLASTRVEQGDYDQARADFRRMLDQFRLVYGPEHRDTLRASSEAFEFEALADGAPGVLNEARALVATAGRTLGPEHEITAQTRLMLGRVLLGAGLSGEAARLLAPLVTSLESHLGPTDRFLIVPLFLLGSAELSLGQHEAARSHLDRALALGDAGSLRLSDRAALRFAAARAHADHAPERACALGREARELHHDLRAPPEQSRAAAIDDWLARRAAICSTPTSPASTRL